MEKRKGIPAIRQRKDKNGKKLDVWEAMISMERDPGTGKSKRLPVYGKTQKECKDKLIETMQSIKTQTFIEPHKTTVEQWLDTWLTEYKKGSIRSTTYSSYEYIIRVHIKPKIGKAKITELKPEQVQKFYNERKSSGLSSRTVRYIHVVLHEALEQAMRNNLIVRNVSEATTLPKRTEKEMRVLTVDEQNKFMETLRKDKIGTLFILDLATGMRRGELLGLRWSDVNLDEEILSVRQTLTRVKTNFVDDENPKTEIIIQKPKTLKGERMIPLLSSIVGDLKQHRVAESIKFKKLEWNDIQIMQHLKDGLVFTNDLGGHIEPRNLTRKFYNLVKASGVDKANFHCMRHTFATRGIENGIQLKMMQDLLGHGDITTTSKYTHALDDAKREAITKLESIFENKEEEKIIPAT